MKIQYLEIVTRDVEATCLALEALHRIEFGDPVSCLGNARTAELNGGSSIGVREPMNAHENPIVRPYFCVENLTVSVDQALGAGAKILHTPTDIPSLGKFAIYTVDGIEFGSWQVD